MESATGKADVGPFFWDLYPNLHYKIFSYCYCSDLKNVSCCNHFFYEAVKPNLWQKVHLPGECLASNDLLEVEEGKLVNLQYTKTLWLKDSYLFNDHQFENYNLILDRCGAVRTFVRIGSQFVEERFLSSTFEKLQNLKGVVISDLIRGSELPVNTFFCLKKLHNVSRLNLPKTLVDDRILKILCYNLSTLLSLDLSSTRVTATGLAGLTNLPNLRALKLKGCRVHDIGLACVANCRSLKRLNISNCKISDRSLHHLTKLTELEWLDVSDNELLSYPYIVEHVIFLRKMKKLFLNGIHESTIIAARSLTRLTILENLTCLEVNHATLLPLLPHDDCLRTFCELTALVRLDLYGCRGFTDKGLKSLGALSELKELMISGHFTDVGLAYISDITLLRQLVLNVTHCCLLEGVTDAGLAQLQKLEHLEDLKIFAHGITVLGFENISKITSLQRLDVSGMDMTSAAFQFLSGLPNLRFFRCANCLSPRPPDTPPTEIAITCPAVSHSTECRSYKVTQHEQAHLEEMLNEGNPLIPVPQFVNAAEGPVEQLIDAEQQLGQLIDAEEPLEQLIEAAEQFVQLGDAEEPAVQDPPDQLPGHDRIVNGRFLFGFPQTNPQPKNEAMRHISRMSSLEMLDITGASDVTDECVIHLKQLRRLKTLVCVDTNLSNAGLGQLTQVVNFVRFKNQAGGTSYQGGWKHHKYKTIRVFR